jgi:hypothetical protein
MNDVYFLFLAIKIKPLYCIRIGKFLATSEYMIAWCHFWRNASLPVNAQSPAVHQSDSERDGTLTGQKLRKRSNSFFLPFVMRVECDFSPSCLNSERGCCNTQLWGGKSKYVPSPIISCDRRKKERKKYRGNILRTIASHRIWMKACTSTSTSFQTIFATYYIHSLCVWAIVWTKGSTVTVARW